MLLSRIVHAVYRAWLSYRHPVVYLAMTTERRQMFTRN